MSSPHMPVIWTSTTTSVHVVVLKTCRHYMPCMPMHLHIDFHIYALACYPNPTPVHCMVSEPYNHACRRTSSAPSVLRQAQRRMCWQPRSSPTPGKASWTRWRGWPPWTSRNRMPAERQLLSTTMLSSASSPASMHAQKG